MPKMKMRDVKVGEAIMYNNEVWVIFDRHEQTRGNLRTYWQIKLKHLDRGNVVEQRFSPDDNVEKIVLYQEEYEYLYRDGDMFVVMHPKTFEQIYVSETLVPGSQHGFMVPNMKLSLLSIEDKVMQVRVAAGHRGGGDRRPRCRPRRHGHVGDEAGHHRDRRPGRVPGHIRKGDKIKVRVEDGEFRGRVGQ